MSADSLIYARLATIGAVAGRVSPGLRRAGTVLPCLVYAVDADDPIAALSAETTRRASITVRCIAETLTSCVTIAADVATATHAATWTSGASTAIRARHVGSSSGLLADSDPGDLDDTREITVTIELFHN